MQGRLDCRSVLIVEDEPIIALDLQSILEGAGASPVHVEHGLEGARMQLARAVPDVVILDLILGGKVSVPLAHELRDRSIPFLFLTGDTMSIPEGLASVPRIPKPFAVDELLLAVEAAASRRAIIASYIQ